MMRERKKKEKQNPAPSYFDVSGKGKVQKQTPKSRTVPGKRKKASVTVSKSHVGKREGGKRESSVSHHS